MCVTWHLEYLDEMGCQQILLLLMSVYRNIKHLCIVVLIEAEDTTSQSPHNRAMLHAKYMLFSCTNSTYSSSNEISVLV